MTANNPPKIGGILLAAGGSTRFGSPKQLAIYHGKSLIRRAAETLVSSGCDLNVVVLGAEIEASTEELQGLPISICLNENWKSGMSSSIKAGLEYLLNLEPKLDAVLITLCDQPHVTTDALQLLLSEFQANSALVVAAKYGKTIGVPAVFSRELFDQLIHLEGDKGARNLIRSRNDLVTIEIDAAAIDIDTPSDVDQL
ncbi:MAG TPA: nucleotidyltransferase family protein [Pyrinomonadaceae bacterium]|nr:nucleotidyltransferase family protein [Acidobacteriota bacterium]HQZ95315.1 nucleotidyltransferase family protein [Pyrinomonadaceae bacterium]